MDATCLDNLINGVRSSQLLIQGSTIAPLHGPPYFSQAANRGPEYVSCRYLPCRFPPHTRQCSRSQRWYWLSPFPNPPLTAQADLQLVGIELGTLPPNRLSRVARDIVYVSIPFPIILYARPNFLARHPTRGLVQNREIFTLSVRFSHPRW
jgi:hypothetical protein